MRPNLNYYVQAINDIVNDTEKIGGEMNPSYEIIRNGIDNDQLSDLTTEKLSQIINEFETGTSSYQTMLERVKTLRPPAKVMGIHKKFEKAYMNYVEGCQEMIQSINPDEATVNIEGFDQAEQKQDEASDVIVFSIERMTKILLNR
ncbi:hypothetical protein ACYSNU_17270 [Enterococcus sp. LJL120]